MNSNNILAYKAMTAFAIPYLTTLGAGLAAHSVFPGWWLFTTIQIAALVAGFSGFNSFLSRSFADHQDGLDKSQNEKTNTPPAV